jgi:hypothetical protein
MIAGRFGKIVVTRHLHPLTVLEAMEAGLIGRIERGWT